MEGNCSRCGIYRKGLHGDHIIPRCLGGSDDESNMQYLCANCHEDKTKEDWSIPAFREFHSQATKESWNRPGMRERAIEHATGRLHTEESKDKIRQKNLENTHGCGHAKSPETRAKIAEKAMGNQRNLGRVMSEETKQKIREKALERGQQRREIEQ